MFRETEAAHERHDEMREIDSIAHDIWEAAKQMKALLKRVPEGCEFVAINNIGCAVDIDGMLDELRPHAEAVIRERVRETWQDAERQREMEVAERELAL